MRIGLYIIGGSARAGKPSSKQERDLQCMEKERKAGGELHGVWGSALVVHAYFLTRYLALYHSCMWLVHRFAESETRR